jgi:hypothetical protein
MSVASLTPSRIGTITFLATITSYAALFSGPAICANTPPGCAINNKNATALNINKFLTLRFVDKFAPIKSRVASHREAGSPE